MPPKFIFDISKVDWDKVVFDQAAIREVNPQRGDMEHLNGIIHTNPEGGEIIGFKDVRADEFWVPGHIPGRPLFPGVLMIEAGAQLAAFYTKVFVGWKGFIGFGGADKIKFRQEVPPGVRLHLLGKLLWERHRRINCLIQGLVKGTLAFEAEIMGTQM